MPYKTIEEIRNVIISNPIPDNINGLDEIDKYLQVIKDLLSSYSIYGHINFLDLLTNISDYYTILDGKVGYEEKEKHEYLSNKLQELYEEFATNCQEEILSTLNQGYIANDELCMIISYTKEMAYSENYEKIYDLILKQNLEFLKYYDGNNTDYYSLMFDKGYSFETVNQKLRSHDVETCNKIYHIALEKGTTMSELMCGSQKIYNYRDTTVSHQLLYILAKEDIDTYTHLYHSGTLNKATLNKIIWSAINANDCDNEFFNKIIDVYREKNENDTIAISFIDASKINITTLNILLNLKLISERDYEKLFLSIITRDNNAFSAYQGNQISQDVCQFMTDDNFILDQNFVIQFNKEKVSEQLYNIVFKRIVDKKPEFIKYYHGRDFEVVKVLINKGIKVDDKELVRMLINCKTLSEEDYDLIYHELNATPLDNETLALLRKYIGLYTGNRANLIRSMNILLYFLKLNKIDIEAFIQYAFSNNYDWLGSIVNIVNNDKINEFMSIQKYFYQNYYSISDNNANVIRIKSFLDLLKNYERYPDLCRSLINNNLTIDDVQKIRFLFRNDDAITMEDGNNLTQLEDLKNIDNTVFKHHMSLINNALNSNDLTTKRDTLSKILFNMSLKEIQLLLYSYGNVADFRQLLFENRMNNKIKNYINEMIVYVAFMEDIVKCSDIDSLDAMLRLIKDNQDIYDNCQKCSMLYFDYAEKMNMFYCNELASNLIDLENIPERLVNSELSKKYGVRVIDLSHSKYFILEHVEWNSNRYENIIKGKSTVEQMFVSSSVASDFNQKLWVSEGIIFATGRINQDLFIKSSVSAFGSNYSGISKGNFEVGDAIRSNMQRGAMETSSYDNDSCSEVLTFAEGMEFPYIVLPGGREPTEDELKIAHQYNLEFLITQKVNESIRNPKPIYGNLENSDNHQIGEVSEEADSIDKLHDVLVNSYTGKPRTIAIFSDAHAMFEPTLAVLEDARLNGATEIYSLGDNVGLGPNPREVMELLDVYGVKSIKGNHEIYAIDGAEKLRKHLGSEGSLLEQAIRNSTWTQSKLTSEQVEKIRALPEEATVIIGGKKVFLTHYIKDLVTGKPRDIPEDIYHTFQGHIHDGKNDENDITTLKGTGPGGKAGVAYYVMITEDLNGGFSYEVKEVPYSTKKTKYHIAESDMEDADKIVADNVVGIGRRIA